MYVDELDRNLEQQDAFENEEFENNVHDEIGYQQWEINTGFPKKYREFITKDAVLGNYKSGTKDFEKVYQYLSAGVYLNEIKIKTHSGYVIITEKNPEGIIIESTNFEKVLSFIEPKDKIKSVKKIYSERIALPKSIHNNLSRAYSKMSMTRGIDGMASKLPRTQFRKKENTLKDETRRQSIFGGFKRKSGSSYQEGY